MKNHAYTFREAAVLPVFAALAGNDALFGIHALRVRALRMAFIAALALPGHAARAADAATGLTWDACIWGQIDAAGGACSGNPVALTWQQALAAARQANATLYRSHGDWRVPNRTELESTVALASATSETSAPFWSSTSHAGDPARAWSVDFSDGASHPADKGETFALRLVRGGELTLSAGNGQRYARYGQRVDSIVMLANTGESGSDVSVRFSLSPGLDASRAQLDCFGAGAGATCERDAADPLRFTVTLPPDRSLTWRIGVPVRSDAPGASVVVGVDADGATPAADTRTLVIFRDGFDTPYGGD